MSKPELTKQLIAQTLKELVKHMPLDKISVQHIVDACELNRKTFYYHFQDKQALICWIFDSEFSCITDVDHTTTPSWTNWWNTSMRTGVSTSRR